MAIAGGGSSQVVVLLVVVSVLQIWVCSCKLQAGGIMVISPPPGEGVAGPKQSKEVWRKYFKSVGSNGQIGLEDYKRRVPNCPDPLHNK